jgi:hypothetical protein
MIRPFVPALAILYFLAAAVSILPYPGIAQDEALFAGGIWDPRHMADHFLFRGPVATMIMPYVGALKSWLYAMLFRVVEPGPWSIRLPMVIAAAGALVLLWSAVRRALGWTAAAFVTALAATDTVYILTATFDWGPVALRHLLAMAAAACFLRFLEQSRFSWLGAAAFFAGLGLWDKFLFAWTLGGAALAAAILYPRLLRRSFTFRAAAIAFLAASLGALPLIRYNIRDPLGTFRGNAESQLDDIRGKANLLVWTLDGRALKGWLAEESEPLPAGGLPLLCLAAAVTLPFLRSRAAIFFLAALATSWLPMLFTAKAGGAAHHTVLLWPLAACFCGTILAQWHDRGWRSLTVLAAILCCVSNARTLHAYRAQLVANGPTHAWTDAIYPLAVRVSREAPASVIAADWGFSEPLRLLTAGRLPIYSGYDFVFAEQPDSQPQIAARIAEPGALHIGFVHGLRAFPKATERIDAEAARLGYDKQSIAQVPDSRGRPVYEIYRFVQPPRLQ